MRETMPDSPVSFLTGSTGFLGQFLLRDLLARGRRVVAMVRPPIEVSRARLAQLLAPLGVSVADHLADGSLVLAAGSMPDDLPEPTWGRIDELISNAASLQITQNGNDEPLRTNCEGTRALIAWARRHGIRRIHHVSTAFVCGEIKGEIPERLHVPRPEFRTDYESSKWLAEQMLDDWAREPGHSLTILRPSWLVGDSRTGYTTQFGGFYQFARLVSMLRDRYNHDGNGTLLHIPMRIPALPEEPQNFVPVDFAARICADVILNKRFHGRIYHVVDPAPYNNEHYLRAVESYFHLKGGHFTDPARPLDNPIAAEAIMFLDFEHLAPRIVGTPRFRADNLLDVLRHTGAEFPEMTRERIYSMLDYARPLKWGAKVRA